MYQNKENGAEKEKKSPAVHRNLRMFFALSIDFLLIYLTALFVTALYSFVREECMGFGGALPAPTQLLVDIFGFNSFALALSYTPFMPLLYAAERKEYRSEEKRSFFLTIQNVYKLLLIYTLLIIIFLLLPFLPFCGYILIIPKLTQVLGFT